jgi:hypothetical protein
MSIAEHFLDKDHFVLSMSGTKKEWTDLREIFTYFLDKGTFETYPNRPTQTDLVTWKRIFDKAVNSNNYTKCNCLEPKQNDTSDKIKTLEAKIASLEKLVEVLYKTI